MISESFLDREVLQDGHLKNERAFDAEQPRHDHLGQRYSTETTKETSGRFRILWSNGPLFAASWIALIILEGTYLELARGRLSNSLWLVAQHVSFPDRVQRPLINMFGSYHNYDAPIFSLPSSYSAL